MKALKYSLIALCFCASASVNAQDADILSKNPDLKYETSKTPQMSDYLFNEVKPDYKIISSNSSYIEVEYYPAGIERKEIEESGERFSIYDFQGGRGKDMKQAGSPDLKYRCFSVMLPSEKNNSIQILDFDVKEEQNVNIAPVPRMNVINPNIRSFENIYYSYTRNNEYTLNKYQPESIAALTEVGTIRDIAVGNLVFNPYQYNPVSRSLKYYSRIRVRINFGENPVLLNRPRSKEEIALLSNTSLNSDIAINWLNPRYKNIYKDHSVIDSKLNTGDWYKIEIKDNGDGLSEGIYRITKSFLSNAGINLSGVDPRTVKIYGNGGNLLPDRLYKPRPIDLEEIAVYFEGEQDGQFDDNDFIFFYVKAINNWDTAGNSFSHYINYYSRSNYYWICLGTSGNGKRMQLSPSENSGSAIIPSSFSEKVFYEPEQTNLISEGNLWLSFGKRPGGAFEWNTTLIGLEANSNLLYRVKPASRCLSPNSNNFLVNDVYSSMPEMFLYMGNASSDFGPWIYTDTYEFTLNQSQKTNGEQVKLKSVYYATNGEAEGYLDWYEIIYKRRFNSASGDVMSFDSPDTSAVVEYNVSSFSNNNIKVFDATAHNNVKIIQPLAVSSSNVRFQRSEVKDSVTKYIVMGQNGFRDPTSISSRISNQNLHGISDGASFVIITNKDFISAADRLKAKRELGGPSNPDYLKTRIVTTEQIFNEFSGGILDAVAIRDFIRYAFENWSERPVYICLLGDGSIDYKNILYPGGNFVPPWELTSPSIDQVAGLTSDDYFVNIAGDSTRLIAWPDLAIGRIPANSVADANAYIDKIDVYENGINNGYWKNKMLFVADDSKTTGPNCESIDHLNQIETLAESQNPPYTPSVIDKIKVYLVNYPTVITPQGRRKPQVNSDIAKYWNDGVLNIHYTGHGSPDVWAHEYVLEKDNIISQLTNRNHYPFISIASCDMSKFDNPHNPSAGELFMMAAQKGAIGTLAASRPVYATSNAYFMYEVFKNLYVPRDTMLLQKRFGSAIFNAKQYQSYSENDAKFILMCDPTIRTQIPRFRSNVDSISGLAGDTMKALSRIKIYGSVIRPDSSLWNDYNGKMILKIYDVDRNIVVYEDCNPPVAQHFRLNGGIIFSGTKNIVNGKWVVEFIVPKDISYLNQSGRLINYFYNNEFDGSGINRNFLVGGLNQSAPVDSIGPQISMYLNTRNFRTGDVVNENFKFIADLFDESGINTTGTIGHKIEGVLDGNENNKYDMTNFYNSDTSYKSGSLEYDFTNISAGRHTLRLKAWDTYNNSSETTIDFDVVSNGALQVSNVYNYPNPFRDITAFTFQHNYPTDINVNIKVYTVAGRLIKQIERKNIPDKFVVINWDGKDEDGETLGNGVYIYKLVVESADGLSMTNTGKLAVLK